MNKITGNEYINPSTHQNEDGTHDFNINKGLTIRQYYAGLAMQGLMVQAIPDRTNANTPVNNQSRAEHAVAMADALISELNKTNPNE